MAAPLAGRDDEESGKPKQVLARHLLTHDDDLIIITGNVENIVLEPKEIKKVWIPSPVTKAYFRGGDGVVDEMDYTAMRRCAGFIGVRGAVKMSREKLADFLEDYFIDKGKTLPAEYLLDSPPVK